MKIVYAILGILVIVAINGGIVFLSWNIVAPLLNLPQVNYIQGCAVWVLFSTILKPVSGVIKK